MDTVLFDGKEYVKAAIIAKRFKYTPDYVGQLCRADKVDARLVGRAWYVTLESIQQHRKGKYKKESSVEPKKIEGTNNNYLSRVRVEPILNKKVVKLLKQTDTGLKQVPVRYEPDDFSLLPKVAKKAVYQKLPVLPAEAEKVKVKKGTKKDAIFRPEPIPRVLLSGALSVGEYETENNSDKGGDSEEKPPEKTQENVVKTRHVGVTEPESEKRSHKVKVRLKSKTQQHVTGKSKITPVSDSSKASRKVVQPESRPVMPAVRTYEKPVKGSHGQTGVSKTAIAKPHSPELHIPKYKESSRTALLPILVAIIAAIFWVIPILSIQSDVIVSESLFTSKFSFEFDNFLMLFSL